MVMQIKKAVIFNKLEYRAVLFFYLMLEMMYAARLDSIIGLHFRAENALWAR